MHEIGERIRALIASGLSPRNDHPGLGACPLCKADVVEGREAYGCSRWREGCAFRLPKAYRGAALAREQARDLLFRGVSLRPITVDGAPRIVCRTATGALIDLAPPAREAQRRAMSKNPRAPRRRRTADGD